MDFLRRLIREIPELIEHFAMRGDKNALLFNNNGLIVFQSIAQLKAKQSTLTEIRRTVLQSLPTLPIPTPHHSSQHLPNSNQTPDKLLQMLEESQQTLQRAYEDNLRTKDAVITELQSKLLLLTDGRSPEQLKQEQQVKAQQRAITLKKLRALDGRWFARKQRQALLDALEQL